MQKKIKKEIVQKVTSMFDTHEMKKHILFDPVYFINGTDKDDPEIKNLKDKLVSLAIKQPSWGLRRPMIWVPLELLITNMRKDKSFILKPHLAEANTRNGDLALSEKQLDDFLLTQHALGKIMYFNQPKLNTFIVIYPPALVNILRSFITDESFWPEDEILRNILRKMSNDGRIKKRDLLKVWQQKHDNQPIVCDEFKEFVIQVLVHLDVLVVPKRHSKDNDADMDCFLVPCTIKNKMPALFLDDKSFANKTISLVYRLQKRTIPSSLTFKLIGAVSRIWPIKEENGRPLLYHSSAVLYVDSKTEFRIIIDDTKVIVYLTHMLSKFTISPDIAASIQECLTFTLNDVLKFYLTSIGNSHKNIDISNLFQIEVGEVCDRSPCVLSISEAKRSSSWTCCSGNQHFTEYPLLWIFDKTREECLPDCTGLHIDALTMLPSDKHLVRLACKLDFHQFLDYIARLGLDRRDYFKIKHQYEANGVNSIMFMALVEWTKVCKAKLQNPSLKQLQDALIALKINQHLLCQIFREDTSLNDIIGNGLQNPVDEKVLTELPKHIGNCLIHLGVELGVSVEEIEAAIYNNPKDMYSQIAYVLMTWKTTSQNPTVVALLKALQCVKSGGLSYLCEKYNITV